MNKQSEEVRRESDPQVPEAVPQAGQGARLETRAEVGPEADPDLYRRQPASREGRPISEWLRIATAVAVGIVLGLGALAGIGALARIAVITFLGITIAMALDPLVDRLAQGRLPRALVVILIYAILVGVVVIISVILTPILVSEVTSLIERVPQYVDDAQAWLGGQTWLLNLTNVDGIGELNLLDRLASALTGIGDTLLSVPVTVVTVIGEFVLVIFISIYWLILSDGLAAFVGSLFPKRQADRVLGVFGKMGTAMGGYVRGLVIDMVLLTIISYLVLLLAGINFPLALGALFGVGELVPIVGPFAAGAVAVIVALFQSPQKALIALGIVLALQQFENNILVPLVMKSQVHISPLLTLLGVTIGGLIGGLLGAIAALPIVAALTAFVEVGLAPAIRRYTGAPEQKEEE